MDQLRYTIRQATIQDAAQLSALRLQVDGETEYLDREPGEAYLDEESFRQLIEDDEKKERNVCLVAVVEGKIVAFSRCQGSELKRLAHRVEFGVGVSQAFWGYGIATQLLQQSIIWANTHGVRKISLHVLETNKKAIALYEKFGFEVEGILKDDKRLSDGEYYNTIVMGRIESAN